MTNSTSIIIDDIEITAPVSNIKVDGKKLTMTSSQNRVVRMMMKNSQRLASLGGRHEVETKDFTTIMFPKDKRVIVSMTTGRVKESVWTMSMRDTWLMSIGPKGGCRLLNSKSGKVVTGRAVWTTSRR